MFALAALACRGMCSFQSASTPVRPHCVLREAMGVHGVSVTRVRRQVRALPSSWAFLCLLCMKICSPLYQSYQAMPNRRAASKFRARPPPSYVPQSVLRQALRGLGCLLSDEEM